jgi:hypothetical protein
MEAFGKWRDELYCSRNQKILPQCKVIIAEFCEGGSMRKWRLEQHSLLEWKGVLFMILYTLAVLNNHFVLRHNDLHQANVLIDLVERDMSRCFCYKICGQSFFIPCTGFFPKLWDFDWCFAPTILVNDKVTRGYASQQNRGNRAMVLTADVHRFLNHIYSTKRGKTPSEVIDFIENVYPPEFLEKTSDQVIDYTLRDKADLSRIPSALQCIMHPFFADFRQEHPHETIIMPIYECPRMEVME